MPAKQAGRAGGPVRSGARRRTQPARARDLSFLAGRLREVGYTPEGLRRLLHITFPDDVGLLNRAPALERLGDERSATATAIRLFFLEDTETYRDVVTVLSCRCCDDLVATGLLQRRGDAVRARVRIDPVGCQYFISDRRFHRAERRALRLPAGDPVYPPSSDSLILRDAIPAFPARHVLDLCAGSGVQGLQLAGDAERVVAVDINPRAVAVARLNARLNRAGNFEACVGDLYAPLRREQFDLVIANPPFVASPYTRAPSYHPGGLRGDRILRRVLAGLARHLRAGGLACAISHLALRAGEDASVAARRWFRHFPGRALVLVLETGTAIDLAAAQSLFALDRGLAAYAAEVRRWVRYLRQHHVSTVVLLLIVAQRSGRPGLEVTAAPQRMLPIPLSPPPAQQIAAWLGSTPRPDM
ncbi:MAG: methyltransferase [Candidatus Binatia bacterium]